MAYKKYIKKNGKIYGPYIYHSKRVDGKVVSEYRGLKENTIKKINKRNFFFIFAAIFLVLFFSLFFSLKPSNISGNVILNLESQYQEDQPLEGVLSINLKEGEMVPESSKIIFENAGNSYEYNLNELIQVDSFEGDFFVEGQDSLGQGLGYGLIGTKTIYPNVYFQFEIVEEDTIQEQDSTEEGVIEEDVIKDVDFQDNLTEDNLTEDIDLQENLTLEENIIQEDENDSLQEEIEETQETQEQEIEEPIEEESQEEQKTEEIVEEPVKEEPQEVVEDEGPSESTLTGNVIAGVFDTLSNVFLGLSATGNVISSELGDIIQADVSYGREFRYGLQEGQKIKIVPESVITDVKQLSVDNLQIYMEGKEIIVKTNYYEEISGFGKEYLGDEMKNLDINLSSLGLNFESSNLKIKLVYEDKEFRSFEVNLGESFIEPKNETLEESEFALTEQEKNVLSNEFEEESVEQTARSYKGWIIVSFNLGDYEVEYSYNKDLSKEELDFLIEKDKLNWLKDIFKELTTEETPSFELDEFNKNYEIS